MNNTVDGFTKFGKIDKLEAAELAKRKIPASILLQRIWFGGARCRVKVDAVDLNEPVLLQKLDKPHEGKAYIFIDGNHRLEKAKQLRKINIKAKILTTAEVNSITREEEK